jgi:hypothetical protein
LQKPLAQSLGTLHGLPTVEPLLLLLVPVLLLLVALAVPVVWVEVVAPPVFSVAITLPEHETTPKGPASEIHPRSHDSFIRHLRVGAFAGGKARVFG